MCGQCLNRSLGDSVCIVVEIGFGWVALMSRAMAFARFHFGKNQTPRRERARTKKKSAKRKKKTLTKRYTSCQLKIKKSRTLYITFVFIHRASKEVIVIVRISVASSRKNCQYSIERLGLVTSRARKIWVALSLPFLFTPVALSPWERNVAC